MTEYNRLDKSFGSTGTSAGILLVLTGGIVSFFYLSGLILLLIGGFVGFTSTSVYIDYGLKRVRFSNNLFGIIPTGKWIQVEPSMKIGIKRSDVTYRTYSRGDRVLDIDQNDVRLVLFNSGNQEIMPLKKFDAMEVAAMELETTCKRLGVSRI